MDTTMSRSSKLRFFFPMLFDLLAPIFSYYILHLIGLNDFIALTVRVFVSRINAAVDVIRYRQAKSVSILVFILFILSIVLAFVTQDARIILLKPSLFIGAAGLYVLLQFLASHFWWIVEPFATQGDPEKVARWHTCWRNNPFFRRKLQIATVLSGVLLLLEAVARVVIVFLLPVRLSVIASNIPGMLLILFFALIGRFYL